jgi:hypothetical protein
VAAPDFKAAHKQVIMEEQIVAVAAVAHIILTHMYPEMAAPALS